MMAVMTKMMMVRMMIMVMMKLLMLLMTMCMTKKMRCTELSQWPGAARANLIVEYIFISIIFMSNAMALAQIPISTFSHIWVFVRQYGIMFVIIVIIIIIIIIYRKVKVSTLKHV